MKIRQTTVFSGFRSALIIILSIIAGNANSQLYGEYAYGTLNYSLCSGATGINYPAQPGVVMAGNRMNSSNNHITITRTSDGGQYFGNSWEFAKEYKISYNPTSCGAPTMGTTLCYGVSVIETNPTATSPNMHYAVAGSFDGGVFYAELDQAGGVINTWFYALPTTASQFPSKPVICESITTPGEYYVAGNHASHLYAYKYVAGAPAPAVAQFYNTSNFFSPNAIVMSPFTGEITIVGEVANAASARDGFFLQLDNTTLGVNNYKVYDNNSLDQSFNSIDICNSPVAGGKGFIIGGFNTVSTAFSGRAWMIKLDPAGNLAGGFSRVIRCASDAMAGAVVGVVERRNTSGQFEHYGTVRSNSRLIVVKLNALGNPPANNEYVYGIGSSAQAVGLSKINNPGWPDEGLQIYALHRVTAPARLYFAQACFSGQSGCSNITNIAQIITVNPIITPLNFGVGPVMTGCYNSGFLLSPVNANVSIIPCSGAPYSGPGAVGGNNSRPAVATGITQLTVDNGRMGVYPNPATGRISVSFNANVGDDASIELFDYLGRLLISLPVEVTSELQTTDINLGSLDMESGIYVISAKINGNISTQKIIYNKE